PARDLIVLTAFLVVLGTLLIQGLTLKTLLRRLDLHDGDPVAKEEDRARQLMLEAAYAQLPADHSRAVDLARKDLKLRLGRRAVVGAGAGRRDRSALRAAREVLLAVRDSGDIGDDAFHTLENELDWMEVSDPLRAANADAVE